MESAEKQRPEESFELEHIATFVEANYALTHEEIMAEILNLDTNIVVSSRSRVELCQKIVRVIKIDKNEVLEVATWDNVYDQGLILPVESDVEQRILLIFRISLDGKDSLGYRSELLVFGVESETKGRIILEKILKYREKLAGSDGEKDFGAIKVQRRGSRPRRAAHPTRTAFSPAYGSTVYMLNLCLDDIEHFGRRLNRCVERDESSGSYRLINSETYRPQSQRSLIECVRKIKYALNLNQEFEKVAPEASEKIFVRLIKITRWLDEICESRIIADYDVNLVKDVVEPLLNDETLTLILSIMPPNLQQFWKNMGPAWNTSASHWPNPLSSYMPQITPRVKGGTKESSRQALLRNYMDLGLSDANNRSGYSSKRNRSRKDMTVPKVTRPKFRNRDHARLCQKVQEHGGHLCFTTVRHVSAKPAELYADQGEVFEILDDSNEDWWTVENSAGDSGLIPSWKLRPFYLDASQLDLKQTDQDDYALATNRSGDPLLYANSQPNSVFYSDDVTPKSKVATHSRPPALDLSGLTTDERHILHKNDPIVLYLSPEQLEVMKNQSTSAPIILMPYGHSLPRTARSIPRSYAKPSAQRESRSLSHLNSSSTIFSPRFPSAYRPTIMLDSKSKTIVN